MMIAGFRCTNGSDVCHNNSIKDYFRNQAVINLKLCFPSYIIQYSVTVIYITKLHVTPRSKYYLNVKHLEFENINRRSSSRVIVPHASFVYASTSPR